MKFLISLKKLCFLSIAIAGLSACTQNKHDISPAQFATALDSNLNSIILLDVRTIDENENKRIKGATNFNINDSNFETKLAKLDNSKPVYVYCLSGGRSSKAAAILENKGFTVYNLRGGINAWQSAGLPMELGKVQDGQTQEQISTEPKKQL